MTDLLPVYLRREPTVERDAPRYGARLAFDVVAYSDPAARVRIGRWPWFYKDKPRKGLKQATTRVLNCWRWRVVWLPDLEEKTNAAA